MKVEIEQIPFENRGIDVTSETAEEKEILERLWNQRAAAIVFTREDNGNVVLTIAP